MRVQDTTAQDLLVVVIVAALALALVVSTLWALARRFRRYRLGLVEAEPKCAGCGYIVHPGSGPICPECGRKRLEVGVYTPATVPPIFPWPLAVAVYILLAVAAIWMGPVVAWLTPWSWDFRAWSSIELPVGRPVGGPRTGTFELVASGTARWWGIRLEEIRVDYTPSGNFTPVERYYGPIHLGQVFWADERHPHDDQEKIRQLVSDAGFEPDGDEGRRRAGEISSMIRQLRRHEWPAKAPSAGYRYTRRKRSGFVEGVLFWIVAAVAAGRLIDRWHWRRRERALERKAHLLRDLGLAA